MKSRMRGKKRASQIMLLGDQLCREALNYPTVGTDFVITSAAQTIEEAWAILSRPLAASIRPDVLIADLEATADNLAWLSRIRDILPELKTVILTNRLSRDLLEKAVRGEAILSSTC